MGERLLGRDVQFPRTQQLLESDVVGEIQRGFRGGNLAQDYGAEDQDMRLTLFSHFRLSVSAIPRFCSCFHRLY